MNFVKFARTSFFTEQLRTPASEDNSDIFANFILQKFNQSVIDGKFPDQLNEQTLVLSLKMETTSIKPIIYR